MTATTPNQDIPAVWRFDRCDLCGSRNLDKVLDLGASPPPCVMHPVSERPNIEARYPLELLKCADCELVQLSVTVDPEAMFAPDFPYSSGNSPQLQKHFQDLAAAAETLACGLTDNDLVVDIGANDGTLLSKFTGCRTLGVEPTYQAQHIQGDYVQAFFDEQVAEFIVGEYGQAKVITACNVLAHVEDIGNVMRGIKNLLAPGGVLIAENHDVASVLAGQWDMVYHEHLRYYSPHSFANLLEHHDLGCFSWKPIDVHGGSFRMTCIHGAGVSVDREPQNWPRLQALAGRQRNLIRRLLATQGPVVGIGAAARATTLINYLGLDAEDIETVYEVPGSDKIGKYIPGTAIPVESENGLYDQDKMAVLLSWHLADLVAPKLRERGFTQPIMVPLPTMHFRMV